MNTLNVVIDQIAHLFSGPMNPYIADMFFCFGTSHGSDKWGWEARAGGNLGHSFHQFQ